MTKINNKNLFIRSLLCMTLLFALCATYSAGGQISAQAEQTTLESIETQDEVAQKHSITFQVTGNDSVSFEPVEVTHGEVYDLSTLLEGVDVSGYNYSITVDGKEVKSITVLSDVTVDVTFKKKIYYTVTINGVDIQMEVGSKLNQPTDPTKDPTEEFEYIFDGWYNGDEKWDFEHDTVNGAINLIAKYKETKRKYTVSFNIVGLEKLEIANVELEYGEILDLSKIFDGINITGYTYNISVGNAENPLKFKVLSDVKVDIQFLSIANKVKENGLLEKFKGCVSGIGSAMTGVVLSGAAVLLLRKKREE